MIQVHKDNETNYRFSLNTKSGQTLLNSIVFPDKIQMDEAIRNLSTAAITRNHFERRTNHQGQFFFNLKDDAGNLIGQSQLYDSEMGMENGIKNLQNRIAVLKEGDNLKLSQNF